MTAIEGSPMWNSRRCFSVLVALFASTPGPAAAKAEQPSAEICAKDGLVHGETGSAVNKHVNAVLHLLDKGARARDFARLTLPCKFRIDPRSGWNLVLSDGTEIRRYTENNPFGFAPAFGFLTEQPKQFTLNFQPAKPEQFHADECLAVLANAKSALKACTSFGARTRFFGVAPAAQGTGLHVGHFISDDTKTAEDFPLADIDAKVESVFYLASPHGGAGTVTLIFTDSTGLYRAYIDTRG